MFDLPHFAGGVVAYGDLVDVVGEGNRNTLYHCHAGWRRHDQNPHHKGQTGMKPSIVGKRLHSQVVDSNVAVEKVEAYYSPHTQVAEGLPWPSKTHLGGSWDPSGDLVAAVEVLAVNSAADIDEAEDTLKTEDLHQSPATYDRYP